MSEARDLDKLSAKVMKQAGEIYDSIMGGVAERYTMGKALPALSGGPSRQFGGSCGNEAGCIGEPRLLPVIKFGEKRKTLQPAGGGFANPPPNLQGYD